jgi:predicted RNA binding protein YcfA (HicA-like mRNA interferase family)
LRLPAVTGQEVLQALKRAGFVPLRQKGSHIYIRHPDGRSTVVPVHKGSDIDRGLLRKIIKDTELGKDEFIKLLK